MTSAAKTAETAPQTTTARSRRDDDTPRAAQDDGPAPATPERQLDDLVRAQEDLARQIRELAARRLGDAESDGDGGGRAVRVLAEARTELLHELLREQQEQARRQLADAARSSEDAVAGVVRGITMIVRSMIPPGLVRPEEFIEVTYSLADQGLRVGRRMVLSVTAGARDLMPLA